MWPWVQAYSAAGRLGTGAAFLLSFPHALVRFGFLINVRPKVILRDGFSVHEALDALGVHVCATFVAAVMREN